MFQPAQDLDTLTDLSGFGTAEDDSAPKEDIKTGPADFLLPGEIRPGHFYWARWDKIPWEAVDVMAWCVAENPDPFGALVARRARLKREHSGNTPAQK